MTSGIGERLIPLGGGVWRWRWQCLFLVCVAAPWKLLPRRKRTTGPNPDGLVHLAAKAAEHCVLNLFAFTHMTTIWHTAELSGMSSEILSSLGSAFTSARSRTYFRPPDLAAFFCRQQNLVSRILAALQGRQSATA
jgi:hypothetical protein